MILTDTYTATLLEGAGHELGAAGGQITADDGWAPRIQSTLTLPIPAESVQELIDPREPRRLVVDCLGEYSIGSPTARSFDLGLRDRVIDHEAGTMTVELASDEALLQDDVLLSDTPNTDALAYQHSLRAIINSVILSRIGATLEPGAADSTFYVLRDSSNILVNPAFRANSIGWNAAGAASRPAITIPGVEHGGFVLRSSFAGAAGAGTLHFNAAGEIGPDYVNVTPGKVYTLSTWVRSTVAVTLRMNVEFAAGVGLGSANMAVPANQWTHIRWTFTAPAGVSRAGVYLSNQTGFTAGSTFDSGAWRLSEGTPAVGDDWGFFDGASTDTDEYGYAFVGAPSASVSTRTALIDRSPELLNWEPGESAWSFIQPLFQAAGLRLFCDEQRRWFLVDASYIADGQTQLAIPSNLAAATDRISRDSDEWFDAALVIYKWNDAADVPTVRYDWYADPGHSRVRTFTIERAYPGPGAARYAVERARGKGRTINGLRSLSRFTAEPAQPVTVTLPNTPIQTGLISRVVFDLDTGLMTIDTRGLTDTPPDAYIFGSPDISYAEVPVGMTYNTFEWSGIS